MPGNRSAPDRIFAIRFARISSRIDFGLYPDARSSPSVAARSPVEDVVLAMAAPWILSDVDGSIQRKARSSGRVQRLSIELHPTPLVRMTSTLGCTTWPHWQVCEIRDRSDAEPRVQNPGPM